MPIDNVKIESNFYPILAAKGDESPNFILNKWDKFDALPENLQKKISSREIAEKIKIISGKFNLSASRAIIISICIRDYYFGEIKSENFPQIFSKDLGLDLNIAQNISSLVTRIIINESLQEKEDVIKIEKLSFTDSLKKYPALGEQLVTGSHIKLKNFPDPVRPSIKNWLSDYTFNIGYESHNSMDRGTYLFQNVNTKTLNSIDRQKLGYLLKAYDENSLVNVNTTLKQIIFPKIEPSKTAPLKPGMPSNQGHLPPQDIFEKEKEISVRTAEASKQHISPPPRISSLASKIGEGKINFSSPHKFPYESQEETKVDNNPQPMRITPRGFKRNSDSDSDQNPNVPLRNVVNLKN